MAVTMWEMVLAALAIAFGAIVSVICLVGIRRMKAPEPDITYVARLIASARQFATTTAPMPDLTGIHVVAFDICSIATFEDIRAVLPELRKAGYKIALLLNLPEPDIAALQHLISTFRDGDISACSIGETPPCPRTYASLCVQLDVAPNKILVISCDQKVCAGARDFGMSSPEPRCDPGSGEHADMHAWTEHLLHPPKPG